MATTMHWIDKKYKLNNILLSFLPLEGSHNSDTILSCFLETINHYELNDKISCITLDNALPNLKFLKKLEKSKEVPNSFFKPLGNSHVRCLAHVFHLVAQALILTYEKLPQEEDVPIERFLRTEISDEDLVDERFINDLENLSLDNEDKAMRDTIEEFSKLRPIAFLRKFLFNIKYNGTKKMTLKALQVKHDVPQTKLVIDVKTRWNSTYDMLTWALINEKPLSDLMWESRLKFKYWDALTILLEFLTLFAKVTSCVASQNAVSLSLALISIEHLLEKLDEGINNPETPGSLVLALKAAQVKIMKYRPKYHSKIFLISTLLHPRAKSKYFFKYLPDLYKPDTDALHEIYTHYMYQTTEVPAKRPKIQSNDLFGEMLGSRKNIGTTTISEIDLYLSMEPQTKSVLEFWKLNSYEFPTLTRIARDIFAIQGTSAAYEREFNGALDITGLRRFNMHEDTFKKLKENQNSLRMNRETDVQ